MKEFSGNKFSGNKFSVKKFSAKTAVLGAGNIAEIVAVAMRELAEVECYAVASRNLEKAQDFAKRHGFQKAYGSYEEMLADEEVELVYIATPHSHHYQHMKLCIEAGKHVLCEKAFTTTKAQAEEIFRLAKERDVLVTEAIWTRYMPSRKIINDLLAGGAIGEVKTLTANLSYAISDKERIIRPELAGGALLDVGVYTLNFALMHFGNRIVNRQSFVQMAETGVDGQNVITLSYEDGKLAILNSGIYGLSDRQGIFYGSEGFMVVENINNPQEIKIYNKKRELCRSISVPEQINGYEYEILETIDCIRNGKRECPSMKQEDTLEVMEMMDLFRKEWGVRYPTDAE